MTANLLLTPRLQALIKRKVDSGLYESPNEVVSEALRLLEERDAIRVAKLETLKKDLTIGTAQLDAGEGREFDAAAIKRQGRRLLAKRARKRR
jgi:antitoxin ParD1/3/4